MQQALVHCAYYRKGRHHVCINAKEHRISFAYIRLFNDVIHAPIHPAGFSSYENLIARRRTLLTAGVHPVAIEDDPFALSRTSLPSVMDVPPCREHSSATVSNGNERMVWSKSVHHKCLVKALYNLHK